MVDVAAVSEAYTIFFYNLSRRFSRYQWRRSKNFFLKIEDLKPFFNFGLCDLLVYFWNLSRLVWALSFSFPDMQLIKLSLSSSSSPPLQRIVIIDDQWIPRCYYYSHHILALPKGPVKSLKLKTNDLMHCWFLTSVCMVLAMKNVQLLELCQKMLWPKKLQICRIAHSWKVF